MHYQSKILNIPQVIRELHKQHEQPTKYQCFYFKPHFIFILQNCLGIYKTCIHHQTSICRKKKKYLRSVDTYLNCSGLYSRRGTNFCIREIAWWTISVLFLGKISLTHKTSMISVCWVALSYRWISVLLLLELCLCHSTPAVTLHPAASDHPDNM